jgi:hypothetical protein
MDNRNFGRKHNPRGHVEFRMEKDVSFFSQVLIFAKIAPFHVSYYNHKYKPCV